MTPARLLAAVAVLAVLSLGGPGPVQAADLQPIDLSVDGGEDAWRAQRTFALHWRNPGAVAAVHYRLLKPSGQVAIGATRLDWAATSLQHLIVPSAPGAYTAEVWLENTDGVEGAPVAAQLRFDDAAPGSVEPEPASAWLGRAAFPYRLRLGHPAAPLPLSGIRGYAASVDRFATAGACPAGACGAVELELSGGPAEDLLAIPELPEGTSYLHAVAVSGSGTRSASPATIPLHVDKTDPMTLLSGQEGGWSSRPLTLTATATDKASGMAATGDGEGPFTAIRIDGGTPVRAGGDRVAATVIASGVHTVAYYARDAAGNVADGGVLNGRPNHAPTTATVKIDREPPLIAFAGAQDPLDPERIEARAADPLSGLDPAGGSIAVRPAGSGERFVDLPTVQSGPLLQAHWDSEAFPPGEYEFRAIARDAAGNSASTQSRADGSQMRLPNPLKISTTLLSGFGGSVLRWPRCARRDGRRRCHQEAIRDFARRPAQRTVPYGRGASFGGRLIAGRRAPLAGMPVRVVERFDPGSVRGERVTTVRADASGAFRVYLDPGPSRSVAAVATPTATLRGAAGEGRQLAVRTGIRVRASSGTAKVGGPAVVFRGAVGAAGATIPAVGKVVQLQFRLPNLPWSEFRTIRTDGRGRFRYAYRFSDDDSRGVRFQFRAFAPAQAGWPFEPAGSPPVAVLGL